MFHTSVFNNNTLILACDSQLTGVPYAESEVWIGLNR